MLKVISADETSITLEGRRFAYLILPSEESVSLWVEGEHNPTFLLSADPTPEGWKAVIAKIREHEARGFFNLINPE